MFTSRFIRDIIQDIKENPDKWTDNKGCGVKKGNIEISGYGNTRFLSVIWVYINHKWMPTTYFDNWALEVTIQNWYRSVPLHQLQKP